MLTVTIIILAALASVNYWFSGNAFLFPSVVFCTTWAFGLSILWMSGDSFYPLSIQTLFILVCGCTAFSVGALVPLFLRVAPRPQLFSGFSERALKYLVLFCIAGVPFFVKWILGIQSLGNAATLLMAIRIATVQSADDLPPGYSLCMNLATGAVIVALICLVERKKLLMIAAFLVASVLNVLTGSKVGIFLLIGSSFIIHSMTSGRIKWKSALTVVVLLFLVFGLISVQVQNGGTQSDAPLADNIRPVVQLFLEYAVGGIVGFDRVVRHPQVIQHNWQISTFFVETANKLGAHFSVPSQHAEYVDVGYMAAPQNVYTAYFAYFDFGIIGIVLLLMFLGAVVSYFYVTAVLGSKLGLLMYGALLMGTVLSPFSEYLFLNLNFLLKLYVVSWILYRMPVLWKSSQDLGMHGPGAYRLGKQQVL